LIHSIVKYGLNLPKVNTLLSRRPITTMF